MYSNLCRLDSVSRKTFWSLHRDVSLLFCHWKIYCQLFESGEDNRRVLNRSGACAFAVMQTALLNEIRLQLCGLAAHRKNVSLRSFTNRVRELIPKEEKRTIYAQLGSLSVLTERIQRQTGQGTEDPTNSTVSAISPELLSDYISSLDLVELTMQALYRLMTESEVSYKNPPIAPGCDGESLLKMLRAGGDGIDSHEYDHTAYA